MKEKVTHTAWDFGIIMNTVTEILGHYPGQKTTKTLCRRRVSTKNIDNANPTCPQCLELLKRDSSVKI